MSDTPNIQTRWKAYPEYQDSEIEWLGEIPSHWDAVQIRYIVRSTPGAIKTGPFGSQLLSSEMTGGEIKVYNQESVITGKLNIGDEYITQDKFEELKSFTIFPRDILVTTRGTIGRSIIFPDNAEIGILHPCLLRIQADEEKINLQYLQILIEHADFIREQFALLSNATTIEVIYSGTMKQVIIPFPPLEEQRAIATFLDRETAKLDDLIATKRTFIERLKEKRSALISQTVTRGLNPDAPMKDSGIEWLGEIPAHWEAIRLKFLSNQITDGEHISPQTLTEGVPLLSAKNVRERYLNYEVDKFISESDAKRFWRRCRPIVGDVLIVSRGATIGRVGLVEEDIPFCLMGSVIQIQPEIIDSKFLYFAMTSEYVQEQLLLASASSAQEAIYLIHVAETLLVYPSHDEQIAIADFIDQQTAKINQLIDKTQATIDTLTEYRTALISATVTGAIDVRGEV